MLGNRIARVFQKMPVVDEKKLDVFPNPYEQRDYKIHITTDEFTCLCPKTGQPDFATLEFDYIPDKLCIELKSLKLYIWSYRDKGMFHEAVTNQILENIVAIIQPRYIRVTARFSVRGGLYSTIVVEHSMEGLQTVIV